MNVIITVFKVFLNMIYKPKRKILQSIKRNIKIKGRKKIVTSLLDETTQEFLLNKGDLLFLKLSIKF